MRHATSRREPAVPPVPHPNALDPALPVEETDSWYACGKPNGRIRQGWKLYVPLTMLNAREALELLVPLVARTGLQFKYVKSIKTLRKLNSGIFGYPQIGKCFVVYMPEVDAELVGALQDVLARYRDECPAVPCARAFGDGLPLYYRYGAYLSDHLRIDGERIDDDRASLDEAVPEGIDDALAAYTVDVRSDPEVAAFLSRFPVFRALAQGGKCGVFHAMNLSSETFEEVALKVGYHRGQVQVDGSDGCSFLRRELAFYELLAERGLDHLAPRLIDELDVPRKVIAALEYVRGTSLLAHKLAGRLTVEHLERAWAILAELHAGGLYLGDAKLGNFLLTEDGDLRAIDFEAAGAIGAPPAPMCTFAVEPASDDPHVADRAHFVASVLFPYEEGRYSWEDRQVDLAAWLEREQPSDAVSRWVHERLEELLDTSGSRRSPDAVPAAPAA